MAGDVGQILRPNLELPQFPYEIGINRTGSEQCFAVGRAIGQWREVALWQVVGDLAAQAQAVGLNTRAGEEDHDIADLHIALNAVLRWHRPHRAAGEDNRVFFNNSSQSRGFSPTPHRPGPLTSLGEAGGKLTGTVRVVEPRRVPDRRVHRHDRGQTADGDQVVDNGRHRVDADVSIQARAARPLQSVSDQVLRTQAFLDMGQEGAIAHIDEVSRLPARAGSLGHVVRCKQADGCRRLALAGDFEGIKRLVIHAAVGVGHRLALRGIGHGQG